MKTPKEYALKLCQEIGVTTMFTECNGGYTLPLDISKTIANISVDKIIEAINSVEIDVKEDILDYYDQVKQHIDTL